MANQKPYFVYEGKYEEQMARLLRDGRKPLTASGVLERIADALESDDERELNFWYNNNIATASGVAFKQNQPHDWTTTFFTVSKKPSILTSSELEERIDGDKAIMNDEEYRQIEQEFWDFCGSYAFNHVEGRIAGYEITDHIERKLVLSHLSPYYSLLTELFGTAPLNRFVDELLRYYSGKELPTTTLTLTIPPYMSPIPPIPFILPIVIGHTESGVHTIGYTGFGKNYDKSLLIGE